MIKINNKRIIKKIIVVPVLIILVTVQIGCSNIDKEKENVNKDAIDLGVVVDEENNQQNDEQTIMDDFYAIVNNNDPMTRVIKFTDNNISFVSENNASIMVNKLMELQKNYLSQLEEKFYNNEMQQKFLDEGKPLAELNEINSINNAELKALLLEARDNGFKVEASEGSHYPIINYELYKKYGDFVSADHKAYIEIMAKESSQVPIKDAGLMIGWDEILGRALIQERFINEYPDSEKFEDVKMLYRRYVNFLFYGTDNTPLFSYDTKMLVSDARDVYANAASIGGESALLKSLEGFLETLSNNDYKISKSVEKYRSNAFKSLTK